MYGRRYAPSSFKCDVLGVYAAPSEYTVTNALVDRSVVAILSGRPVHVSCHFHVTVLLAAIALLAIQFDTMLELPYKPLRPIWRHCISCTSNNKAKRGRRGSLARL
jgi:hypothetical protein